MDTSRLHGTFSQNDITIWGPSVQTDESVREISHSNRNLRLKVIDTTSTPSAMFEGTGVLRPRVELTKSDC